MQSQFRSVDLAVACCEALRTLEYALGFFSLLFYPWVNKPVCTACLAYNHFFRCESSWTDEHGYPFRGEATSPLHTTKQTNKTKTKTLGLLVSLLVTVRHNGLKDFFPWSKSRKRSLSIMIIMMMMMIKKKHKEDVWKSSRGWADIARGSILTRKVSEVSVGKIVESFVGEELVLVYAVFYLNLANCLPRWQRPVRLQLLWLPVTQPIYCYIHYPRYAGQIKSRGHRRHSERKRAAVAVDLLLS